MIEPINVMVTGATAPFGAAIVDRLLASPEITRVLAVGRESVVAYADNRVSYCAVDLTHARAVRDLLHGPARELSIGAVIHAAHHRSASDRGPAVHRQNVDAARELVLGCADHPTIQRLVYRSFAEVYAQGHATSNLMDEDAPLDFDPAAPQWARDRVEADLTVCAHLGGRLQIAVLRFAELLAPGTGSQLWDYLASRVCLRPVGFDPIVNVASVEDGVAATLAALRSSETGVFNIAGADTLPLSRAITESGRADIPVPGMLMNPLYRLRSAVAGFDFRYDLNARRFHFGGVVDGTRARRVLGYRPSVHVRWPQAWWRTLLERLGRAA